MTLPEGDVIQAEDREDGAFSQCLYAVFLSHSQLRIGGLCTAFSDCETNKERWW
jgi:hypothetical protein